VVSLFGRVALTMMLAVALAVAWLSYSFSAAFENWPWTVRHTYRSGSFEGVTIGSTKPYAMEQILLRRRQGALDSVVLIDDAGVLVTQESAGGPLKADAVQLHWACGPLAPGITRVWRSRYEVHLQYGVVFFARSANSHRL
jgi:hypothetical protein